jgi:hypothetical protein
VLIGTNEGNLLALDAASGKALWDFGRRARLYRPISYEFENWQYLAVAVERSLMAFAALD